MEVFGSGARDEVSTTVTGVTQQELLSKEVTSEPVEASHHDYIAATKFGEQSSKAGRTSTAPETPRSS